MRNRGTQGARSAIENLIAESHYLVDVGRSSELADRIFASEAGGLVPEADFGFAVWRGTEGIRRGFDAAMPRFEATSHAISNMHITIAGNEASARYYVQGWHWLARVGQTATKRNVDFLVLGIMTDHLVRQRIGWRILRRRLQQLGPGLAVGVLPDFLDGLGADEP